MQCPVCREIDLVMTDRQSVEIDYCPQCRGVWLDRGELDKIIERTMATVATAPLVRERHDHDDDDEDDRYRGEHDPRYPKKKKRGSFLSELFDF
jgi:Zn-finger nucleic acid-binding protein